MKPKTAQLDRHMPIPGTADEMEPEVSRSLSVFAVDATQVYARLSLLSLTRRMLVLTEHLASQNSQVDSGDRLKFSDISPFLFEPPFFSSSSSLLFSLLSIVGSSMFF